MRMIGQLCLLSGFVGVGYSAFACLAGARWNRRTLERTGLASALGGTLALTVVMVILAWALLVKDFRFHYVAQYSNRLLPWHYSLSALWVGQAGSLLLWTWMLGVLALLFRFFSRKTPGVLRETTFGILMAYCCFLTATMVFAADPVEVNLAPGDDGAGLSPLLQHPAMLIHPPIVFLGYAAWGVPCALATAALVTARGKSLSRAGDDVETRALSHTASSTPTSYQLDSTWVRLARPWALIAWTILGSGILLGAYWSYEELGWGGYWAWDPVENGSLIPWLVGTALIHTLMAWQYRGVLKKTAVALAIAAFALCNFATFLTRSGIFSSLHAFSQSPIGWLFLGWMVLLGGGGAVLIVRRREDLAADKRLHTVWSREAFVLISVVALLLLVTVTVAGTLSVALSDAIVGRRILVGPAFYNYVLIPIGLLLLATLAAAPLLRWGAPPGASQRRVLFASAAAATLALVVVWLGGVHHPLGLAVAWLVAFSVASLSGSVALDSWRHDAARPWKGLFKTLVANQRLYAGSVIHMGFVCVAVGITGSSLGSRRHEVVMNRGDVIEWSDRSIRFERLIERDLPDKYVVEAELAITPSDQKPYLLRPAQHLHRLQDEWTTEVAIHSTWGGDFYTILHSGDGRDAVRLTLVENPLMRWMWLGPWVIAAGTVIRLGPSRRREVQAPGPPATHSRRTRSRGRRPHLAAAPR